MITNSPIGAQAIFFSPSRKCFERSSPASAKYLNELPLAGEDLQAKALKTSSKDHWSKWEDYLFTAHYASVFYSDSLTCWFAFFFFCQDNRKFLHCRKEFRVLHAEALRWDWNFGVQKPLDLAMKTNWHPWRWKRASLGAAASNSWRGLVLSPDSAYLCLVPQFLCHFLAFGFFNTLL